MKRIAAAAFICVGLFTLTSCNNQVNETGDDLENSPLHTVQQWSEEYTAGDYFLYANECSVSSGQATAMSLADYAIPYEETRYFSDDRQQLEAEQVIPEMEQPGFDLYVNYLET